MSVRIPSLAVVLAALALTPAAASAAPQWAHDSPISEQSAGYLACAGTRGDVFDRVLPSIDFAEAFIDQAALPPRGGVQYVRVQWFAVGGDDCRKQGGTGTSIEIIPPPGVELALGPTNPAQCGFSIAQDAAVCPVVTAPGAYGGTLLNDGRSGQGTPWPVTDRVNKTRLIVPVRLTRPVASFAQSAERRCNAAPCPPGESGDRVQFVVRFAPGTGATPSRPLVTTVGLLGGGGPAAGPAPLARPAPASVRRSGLRRGVTLRVRAPAGATARATLKVGARTLAATKRRARTGATLSLRLRASAKAIRGLGAGARNARLTVTVVSPGQAPRRQTATIRITP